MREHGLKSHKRRRLRVVTTDSKHAHPVAPNVLERDFEATAPNQKWLADMTYVPTKEGCTWHWCWTCTRGSSSAGR